MLSLPLLVIALATAATPEPLVLPLETKVPVRLSLEVQTARQAAAPALAWSSEPDGTLGALATAPEWEAEVQLTPVPGGALSLSVTVRWLVEAEEQRIALSLWWPGAPSAVNRSLRFGALGGPLRVERGTPLLVRAGGLVLAGGPGLAATRVEPLAGGTRAILYLDDASARPFSTFETCYQHLPGAQAGQRLAWGRFDPRRPHLLAPRAAGQEDRLEVTLYPLAEDDPFLPVVLERWPGAARAAVVFTDHADRTDPDALRAVLWGDSDGSAVHPGAGFLGRGLRLTRSFFVHGRGSTLDRPEVRALADDLRQAGSEVALHGITSERDGREAVRTGLADVAELAPATWIDHEPYTNCEAVSAQGWGTTAPFGIRDLLAGAGVRWIWAAGDEGNGQPRIFDLLGGPADAARAAIAPFPLDDRLWLFRSSMFFASPETLGAALSDRALGELEESRGLFVAHTYLGPSARTTRLADHLARLAVRPRTGGGLVIDPALDAALERLARHVRAGRLASLTWTQAGDRLRALGDVEVAYLLDGGVELRNLGTSAIDALALSIPVDPEVELVVDDAPPLGRDDSDGVARIWLDLPAGGSAVLRAFDRLAPLPFLPAP